MLDVFVLMICKSPGFSMWNVSGTRVNGQEARDSTRALYMSKAVINTCMDEIDSCQSCALLQALHIKALARTLRKV